MLKKMIAITLMLALQTGLSFPEVSGAAVRQTSVLEYGADTAAVDRENVSDAESFAEESLMPEESGSPVVSGENEQGDPGEEEEKSAPDKNVPENSEGEEAEENEEAPPGETSPEPDKQAASGMESDETVILVSSYDELRAALSEKNAYTTIYLTADITADSAGISIHPEKTAVVIDGSPPDGGRYTLTQYQVTNTASLIKVNSNAAAASVTLRNMDITGKNSYGVVWVADSKGAAVTLTFENVVYSGPQLVYHRLGTARILGGSYAITSGELAEALHIEIGGTATIENASINSVLWLYSTSSTLRFLENADVDINAYYLVYGNIAAVTLETGAQVNLTGRRFGFSYAGNSIGTFKLAENAGLTMNLNTPESYAALRVSKEFHMSRGSSAAIIRTGTAGIPLRLTAAGAKAVFDRPRRVFFYSSAGVPLRFTGAGTLEITASALNVWSSASWPLPEGMETLPGHIWNKADGELLTVTGKYSETINQSLSHNLTGGDPVTTSLDSSNFNLEKSQLIAFGEQSLSLYTPDGGAALSGKAAPGAVLLGRFTLNDGQSGTVSGSADAAGSFRLELPGILQADSEAAVLARHHDLLIRQNVTVPDPAKHRLSFLFVPESTSFGALPVPGSSSLVTRMDGEFDIGVEDTRMNPSAWRIDANIVRPLTAAVNGEEISLPGAVVFAEADGTVRELSEIPLPVYRENSAAAGEFRLCWGAAEGVLLKLLPGEIYSGAVYTTTIQWTLVDAP